MRKGINKILITIVSLFLSTSVVAVKNTTQVFAADYTSDVVIESFEISNSTGALSTDNVAKYLGMYQLKVNWSLTSGAQTLQAGDTFSIDLPRNAEYAGWTAADSGIETLYGENQEVIGQWQILNNKIVVTLDASIDGLSSIRGQFTTGSNALKNSNPKSITQDVIMGDKVQRITFEGNTLIPTYSVDSKYASLISNSRVLWVSTINAVGAKEIAETVPGSNGVIKYNSYFEDELIDGGRFAGVRSFTTYLMYPLDLEVATGGGAAANAGFAIDITSHFTTVTQNPGESYADFKARLQPFEMGVWEAPGENQKVVVNFGDIGANGMKYSSIRPTFAEDAASMAINIGYYPESERQALVDYFNQTYGDQNALNGHTIRHAIFFDVDYDLVVQDTVKRNVAYVTMNDEVQEISANAILRGNLANIEVSRNTAAVVLADSDTNELLANGQFRLEYNNGGVWEPYTSAYTSEGTLTTNSSGYVATGVLGAGTYRFVQTQAPSSDYDLARSPGYDATLATVVSAPFVIDPSATEGVRVLVYNTKYRYTVTYQPGDHGIFNDVVYTDVIANSNTPAFGSTPVGQPGYEFTGWSPAVQNTVTEDAVYVAQWRLSSSPISPITPTPTPIVVTPEYLVPNTGVQK